MNGDHEDINVPIMEETVYFQVFFIFSKVASISLPCSIADRLFEGLAHIGRLAGACA